MENSEVYEIVCFSATYPKSLYSNIDNLFE